MVLSHLITITIQIEVKQIQTKLMAKDTQQKCIIRNFKNNHFNNSFVNDNCLPKFQIVNDKVIIILYVVCMTLAKSPVANWNLFYGHISNWNITACPLCVSVGCEFNPLNFIFSHYSNFYQAKQKSKV